nr:hypothetical protein [Amycolatopsis palatopharyngis]
MMQRALWQGLLSGAAGVTVMTPGEKLEQSLTNRPNFHVPARVLQRLIGMREHPGRQPQPVNWAMHFGQDVALGVLRSVMAHAGLRGPWSSTKFTVILLTNDQILANATGAVADALAARIGPGPGQRHAAILLGRHSDVGSPPRAGTCSR